MAHSAEPPIGTFLQVGGRRLFVLREGEAAPTVVFLSGAGAVGLDYLNLHQGVAPFATALLYDRAGTGFSERATLPRMPDQVIDELRELLRVAELAGPCILVGHSLGGLYARRYAQRFPDDVAGLVLLDPAHEDMTRTFNDIRRAADPEFADRKNNMLLPPQGVAMLRAAVANGLTRALLSLLPPIARFRTIYRRLFASEFAAWPDAIRDLLVERHVSLPWMIGGMLEAQNLDEIYGSVRDKPMPDIPMIVLCSTEIDEFARVVSAGRSDDLMNQELEGKRRLYEAFARTVPRGELRPMGGGHVTMSFRHPEPVIQAIRDIVQDTTSNARRASATGR